MKDLLGDRIKSQYEDRARFFLPRRTYTIIRIDGKAFHTYTKGMVKPFDLGLIADLDAAVLAIMPEIQGAQFAYVQSDEISILLTDFAKEGTSAWFDGNIQKIASVSSSLMTAEFNNLRLQRSLKDKGYQPQLCRCEEWSVDPGVYNDCFQDRELAFFDARAFTIPDPTEVYNYFVWRNQDAARNSLSAVAYAHFSHSQLEGVSSVEKRRMLMDTHGINWDAYDNGLKFGRLIFKETYTAPDESSVGKMLSAQSLILKPMSVRSKWAIKDAELFTANPKAIKEMIPKYE